MPRMRDLRVANGDHQHVRHPRLMAPAAMAMAMAAVVLVAGMTMLILSTRAGGAAPAAAGPGPHDTGVALTPVPGPAYADDAPDPDVVRVGTTYYAYTTGTTWGNYIGVLVDTSGSPTSGWHTVNGQPYGSSALPVLPSWEQPGTQWAPGVIQRNDTWYLYYAAFDPKLGHS